MPGGFWRRAAALLIDAALLTGIDIVLALLVITLAPKDLATLSKVSPVSSAIAWAYFTLMESSPAQAALGKIALGIKVVDLDGAPISFRRASARYWLKALSTLLLWLGWLLAAVPPRNRALHDLLSGTRVVRSGPVTVPRRHWDPLVPGLTEYWDGPRWVLAASCPGRSGTARSSHDDDGYFAGTRTAALIQW